MASSRLGSRTLRPSPWLQLGMVRRHRAVACTGDCNPSVASCAAARPAVVAGAARTQAAVVFASSGSSGLDVEVVDARVDMRRVVVDDIARRIPCRIEESGEKARPRVKVKGARAGGNVNGGRNGAGSRADGNSVCLRSLRWPAS